MRRKVWLAILLVSVLGLVSQAETVTLGSVADTWLRDGRGPFGGEQFMNAHGTYNFVSYLRFDLSSLGAVEITDVSLVLTKGPRPPATYGDTLNTGRFALYGMNNVESNTAQNWDENVLTSSNAGQEWDKSTLITLGDGRVTNLDAGDAGVNTVETITGSSTIMTVTGADLITFLQSRVNDGGLSTFIIAFGNNTEAKGISYATKEYTVESARPTLIVTYIAGRAINPVPQSESTVNKADLTQLEWTLLEEVAACRVYFGTEPNLLEMDSIYFNPAVESVNIDTFSNFSTPLAEGTYYWRVDCWDQSYADPNSSDPNYFAGQFWSFTATSIPIIEQQTTPAEQILSEGDTAVFTVVATSPVTYPVTYIWYRSPDNVNNTPGDDVAVGTNSPTLTLPGLTRTNEGYYYCKATNSGGSAYSNTANLAVKRNVAHWTLDSLVSGQYADSSGEGHNADPNGTPSFVAGAGVITGNGVVIDPDNGYASAGTWNPSLHTGQFTISLWAKWAGQTAPTSWQGLIAKENSFGATTMMWQLEADMNNNNLALKSGTSTLTSTPLPVDTWIHVTVVFNGTTATIYRNGVSSVSGAFTQGTKTDAPVLLGASSMDTATGLFYSLFNGVLDDVRLYNYALTWNEVIDLYHAVSGQSICTNKPTYDYTGDCMVTVADFATFATQWLNCGLYPDCP